jgi:hypothetical protein
MKIAMHEITARDGTFPEHMEAYAKTGWKHFEINMWVASEYINENGLEATVMVVKDKGLACVGATSIGMNAFGDENTLAADEDVVKTYGERMQALGPECKSVVVGCNHPEEVTRERGIAKSCV